MKCRVEETRRFSNLIGSHVHYLVETADSRRFVISWTEFGIFFAVPIPHPHECMAFEVDENWEVQRFDELACAYDLGPEESLAVVCGELGLEMDES